MIPVSYSDDQSSHIKALLEKNDDTDIWTLKEIDYLRSHIKKHYVKEQQFECCYCRQSFLSDHGRVWDIEHVIPQSTHRAFTFEPRNLALACIKCNGPKSNHAATFKPHTKFPESSEHYCIVHPHFDEYNEHIEISLDLKFTPLTGKGAYTVLFCNLTRYKDLRPATRKPISDKRFDRDMHELRFVADVKEALPIVASILTTIELNSTTNPQDIDAKSATQKLKDRLDPDPK